MVNRPVLPLIPCALQNPSAAVFPYMPSNHIKNLAQYRELDQNEVAASAQGLLTSDQELRRLQDVRGHLVAMPLDFLDDDALSECYVEQALVPKQTFT